MVMFWKQRSFGTGMLEFKEATPVLLVATASFSEGDFDRACFLDRIIITYFNVAEKLPREFFCF